MYGLGGARARYEDALSRMGWGQFEALLVAAYRRQGYRVEQGFRGGGAHPDGSDLKLFRREEFLLVRCRYWDAREVPHNAVHDLLGATIAAGATGAILVTSGDFSAYARESARRHGEVRLVDGDALRTLLAPLMATTPAQAAPARHASGGRASRRPMTRRIEVTSPKLTLAVGGALFLVALCLGLDAYLRDTAAPSMTPVAPMAAATAPAEPRTPFGAQESGAQAASPVVHVGEHAASQPASSPPTAEDVRESQRRAEEAIRVLEASTPEIR